MSNFSVKEAADYAWKHFEVLAEQRLRTFNFYIVLLAATVGASLTALHKNTHPFIFLVIGIFCMIVSIVFLIIELRSKRLLEIPKSVLKDLEGSSGWPDGFHLFKADRLDDMSRYHKTISYSFAFRATFGLHFIYGLLFALIYFCPHMNPVPQEAITTTKETPAQTQAEAKK